MMNRNELLKTPEYWITKIQIALYNCAETYMMNNHHNRTQLAKHLGVTKGYVTQLLNGDYDHKLSKLVELSLSFGFVPKISFIPIDEYLVQDTKQITVNRKIFTANYESVNQTKTYCFSYKEFVTTDEQSFKTENVA